MKIVINRIPMPNKSNSLGRWAFVVSIIAIIISLGAVLVNYYMYIETTKPHVEFDELHNKLKALDSRINRVESWMEGKEGHKNYSYWIENLSQAKSTREEAWRQWINDNITKSEEYIIISYNSLDQIPIGVEPTGLEMSWCFVIVVVIIGGVATIFALIKTGYIYFDNEKPGKKK